ncbi:DHHA1 domain-containing protein [Thermodesulfovibrionales bacterium]|nr:DHHA1 domain-containing protein [Thermodesulfovibrionales bacterium]
MARDYYGLKRQKWYQIEQAGTVLGPVHAGSIIEKVAAVVGGSSGGRPAMAQSGSTMPEKLDQALEEVCKIVLENQKESHA